METKEKKREERQEGDVLFQPITGVRKCRANDRREMGLGLHSILRLYHYYYFIIG
jgi:hypothetical protein